MQTTVRSVRTSGSLNPMYGKRHGYMTKQKMSDSQKKRYADIRNGLQEDMLDYADTSSAARKDVLLQLLDNNELKFQNVQQAVNFLASMLTEERIARVLRDEINKFIGEDARLVSTFSSSLK